MFSVSMKRSVVAVGVVAGLLAAAGPASAESGGADFTRFASPGPHIGASVGTSKVFGLYTFGTYDPVEHVTGGIVTDNKDPDKVWADPAASASNASGAVLAADFNYYERATGFTAPLGSTKGSFIDGHSAAVESGYEIETPPHADGAALGFFDIPAELKSVGSSVKRP